MMYRAASVNAVLTHFPLFIHPLTLTADMSALAFMPYPFFNHTLSRLVIIKIDKL